MSGSVRSLALLTVDALQDALRRRTILAVLVVCVLIMMGFDSCTEFWSGEVEVNGERFPLELIGQYAGMPMMVMLALGVTALAGILASDELARPLDEGSANLWLARPVSRTSYALSRLLGTLLVSFGVALLLIGGAAVLLHLRQGLPLVPAVGAFAACAVSAGIAAALAMATSLWLPRIPTLLVGALVVFMVAVGNSAAWLGGDPGGSFGLADRFGPPFGSAVALALHAWTPDVPLQVAPGSILLRLGVWLAASVATLLLAFRRLDLPR